MSDQKSSHIKQMSDKFMDSVLAEHGVAGLETAVQFCMQRIRDQRHVDLEDLRSAAPPNEEQ